MERAWPWDHCLRDWDDGEVNDGVKENRCISQICAERNFRANRNALFFIISKDHLVCQETIYKIKPVQQCSDASKIGAGISLSCILGSFSSFELKVMGRATEKFDI